MKELIGSQDHNPRFGSDQSTPLQGRYVKANERRWHIVFGKRHVFFAFLIGQCLGDRNSKNLAARLSASRKRIQKCHARRDTE